MYNKVKNVIIIILAVLVLSLGGYLVYDKVFVGDNLDIENNAEKEDVEEENEVFYNTLAKTLVDNIIELDVYNIFERLSKSGLSDEIKLSMAISSLEPVNSYTCLDAFDVNTGYVEYRPAKNNAWGCGQNEKVDSFDYDLVNEEYKNLFGGSENALKISVLETWVYDYSNKIDGYVRLTPRFGPIVNSLYYYDIEDINITNEQLKIKISYLTYAPVLGSVDTFRYILNDISYTEKTKDEIKKAYYDNKNLLPRLIFNYEKDNGKYILKSVKSEFEK